MDKSLRRKILVSAYACNPYKGSEEGVGWDWVKVIAEIANPCVMVASFHRSDIEHYLATHPVELTNVTFVYVPHRWWHYQPTPNWERIEGSILKPIMNIVYMRWLRDAYKLAKRLHQEQTFDLAHQLTYVGFRFPGRLWKLDVPFVWGPIGGLENTPWRFLPVLGIKGAMYYAGRNLINAVQRVFLRSPRKAFRRAGEGVVAATSGIKREIKRWYGVESHVICEVGPPEKIATDINQREADQPLQLLWSGEHLPGKAFPLLLGALSRLDTKVDWRLQILGHGPLTATWQQESQSMGIDGHCHWHGLLPRDSALNIMSTGHLFVITSLKDLTSTVLLEALSLGLPVVCPDHCGFSDVVTEECGIKLSVKDPAHFEHDLTEAIENIDANEGWRRLLAHGALRRAPDFSWEKKRESIANIYQAVTEGQQQVSKLL